MKTAWFTLVFLIVTIFIVGCGEEKSSPPANNNQYIPQDTYEDNYSYDITPDPLSCDDFPEEDNDFRTDEYCASASSLGMIKASYAYISGASGQGITVAVLDSGMDFNHNDLKDNISIDSTSITDYYYDISTSSAYKVLTGIRKDQVQVVNIDSGYRGNNYDTAPKITIEGDGVGATAIAILETDGSKKVDKIYIIDGGFGYTYANAIIDNADTNGSGLVIQRVSLGGYDYFASNDSHGTKVGSIIAGVKNQSTKTDIYDGSMQGVAYNATLLNVKLTIGWTYASNEGIDYAVAHGADVINISYGSYGRTTSLTQHYIDAQASDTTIVLGAGNDGSSCSTIDIDRNESIPEHRCFFPASIPFTSDGIDLLSGDGGWIIVGSVKEDGVTISDFSNRAGLTKNNYIVTSGENVTCVAIREFDYVQEIHYSKDTGTSFSAPQVAGAVALLKEKYPQFLGKEIAQILFDSATDLGEAGVDDIYGHGLMNLKAAFQLAEVRANVTQP